MVDVVALTHALTHCARVVPIEHQLPDTDNDPPHIRPKREYIPVDDAHHMQP